MFKRANKMTALLVAAAAVISLVPATGVNAADVKRIDSKDGTVYNAQAYKDGCFVVDGDVVKEDNDEVYYLKDGKYTKLEDLDSGDDFDKVTSAKYLEMQGGDYFVDLTNGKTTDDNVREDNADDAASALRKNVKKDTDGRYAEKSAEYKSGTTTVYGSEALPDLDKAQIAGARYGDTWYATKYVDKKATIDAQGVVTAGKIYNVYADAKGKYIDADYNIGKIKVETTTGTSITLKNTDTDKLVNDDDIQAKIISSNIIGQDKNNIYRQAEMEVTVDRVKTSNKGVITEINGVNVTVDQTTFRVSNDGYTVKFDTIQKVSKDQASDDVDGAKYSKSVTTYIVSKDDGKQLDGKSVMLVGDNDYDAPKYTVADGKVIAYSAAKDTKKNKAKVQAIELKSKSSYYYTDAHDYNDDDVTAMDTDVDGNLWMTDGGFVYKFDNDEDWDKVYKVDGSMDKISVYNKDNMAVWNEDDEVYSIIGNKEEAEKPAVTTGWAQATDGTWTYVNADGTKATGWLNLNGAWYFLNAQGVMGSGWVNDNGTWYYTNASGAMQTGWVNANGTWYYTNASGAMQTGWVNDNGTWYYTNASGAMQANTVIDGYTLAANGAML